MDKKQLVEYLDKLLLSKNVVSDFHKAYEANDDFRASLISLLPEIEQCYNQEQRNPWHIYNVFDHILHSVEEMNKKTINMKPYSKKILAYTMFLHDIGKPACHIRRMKNGVEIDSFFNHNKESEKIAKRFLSDLGFTKQDIDIIAKLVEKHDIFMFISDGPTTNPYHRELSPKVIVDEYNELNQVWQGQTMLRFLVLVGKCDNLAQNPKMARGPQILLGKFNKLVDNLNDYLAQEQMEQPTTTTDSIDTL